MQWQHYSQSLLVSVVVLYYLVVMVAHVKELQKVTGIKFQGHHTLRRTGGRLMWLAGVPIETIASIMGHESTEMTLRYIGVNLSDQTKAFEAVRNLRSQMQKTAEIVPFVALPAV